MKKAIPIKSLLFHKLHRRDFDKEPFEEALRKTIATQPFSYEPQFNRPEPDNLAYPTKLGADENGDEPFSLQS